MKGKTGKNRKKNRENEGKNREKRETVGKRGIYNFSDV